MADKKRARKENRSTTFFVDDTCIDCGTCYWMEPRIFVHDSGMSATVDHEYSKEMIQSGHRALLSCPTNSIGYLQRPDGISLNDITFPHLINENIYHCGHHSRSSFGATSYFIKCESGNILIDSPQFIKKLTNKFESLGGISYQALTHKDDIADTNLYHQQFTTKRAIHSDDLTAKLSEVEIELTDEDYWITDELLSIHVPGHTKGHVCFLYKNKYLFTGDHLAYSRSMGHLYAFVNHCWYDLKTQYSSLEKLLNYDFEYVLPGHSAPFSTDAKSMKKEMEKMLKWVKSKI